MPQQDNAYSDVLNLAYEVQQWYKSRRPAILYLGNNASCTASGTPIMEELRKRVITSKVGKQINEREFYGLREAEREEEFERKWHSMAVGHRHNTLRDVADLIPDDYYQPLARLLAQNYFDMVLTSNIDPMLEYAISQAGIRPTKWYTIANGRDNPEQIGKILANKTESVSIIKLCGDLSSWSYRITCHEVENSMQILSFLTTHVWQPIIMSGYSLVDDVIFKSFPKWEDVVYFSARALPMGGGNYYEKFKNRHEIVSDQYVTRQFWSTLAENVVAIDSAQTLMGDRQITSDDVKQVAEKVHEQPPDTQTEDILLKHKLSQQQPLVTLIATTILSVHYGEDKQLSFDITGELTYRPVSNAIWRENIPDLRVSMHDLGRDIVMYYQNQDRLGLESWRRRAKREGSRLYNTMMEASPELARKLDTARQLTNDTLALTLAFSGPRESLSIPYELLHDGTAPLSVCYPLCRQIDGINVRHNEGFSVFMRESIRNKKQIRLLLVAAGDKQLEVDEEIKIIKKTIEQAKQQSHVNITCEVLFSHEATSANFTRLMEKGNSHIVHFAGHSSFDPDNSQKSGLYFPKNNSLINTGQLANLLRGSETRLFYLSSCVGAGTGSSEKLISNDYLGLMDSVVLTGVPYVLGFRWFVTDRGANLFARYFYKDLMVNPFVPEQAAWKARKEIYGSNGNDETWASPILVAQNLYRS